MGGLVHSGGEDSCAPNKWAFGEGGCGAIFGVLGTGVLVGGVGVEITPGGGV